jgi:hypothetical protein
MTGTRRILSCDDARDLAAGYVLGALDPDEDAAVREHLATCDQLHAEFEELAGVVPALLASGDLELVEPPAGLRDRILAAAAADLATTAPAATTAAASAPAASAAAASTPAARQAQASAPAARPAATTPFPGPAERAERAARRDGRGRTSALDWVLRVAAVVAIAAIGTWGLGLQRQLATAQEFDQAVARVIDAAGRPGSTAVVLTAAEGRSGSGIAAVGSDGSVVLAMRNLPATNGSQVYETWVIAPEQQPVAVGGFTVDADGTAGFTTRPFPTPPGAVIALTLEPNAGNLAPMGPVVSSGTAVAPAGATG